MNTNTLTNEEINAAMRGLGMGTMDLEDLAFVAFRHRFGTSRKAQAVVIAARRIIALRMSCEGNA